jgi:hypothetical protein
MPAAKREWDDMPIVYVHGVAVRDHQGKDLDGGGLIDRLLQNITWETIEPRLRQFIAPEIASDPSQVVLLHAYWGDLAGRLAWDGASCLPDVPDPKSHVLPLRRSRSHLLADLRRPLNQLVAQFFGDIVSYLNFRGDAANPGPIPLRILDTLATAQQTKELTGEPIIVVTNSMGGQIMYDIVTYFLPALCATLPQSGADPRLGKYSGIRVDFWCSVAAQVGLFEELKLFLASQPAYSKEHGNRVPFPDQQYLGTWWNVWDVADVISYGVHDIIEGVDDTPFDVGKPLLQEHIGYLQQESFYTLFAERVRQAFGSP